MSGSFDNADTSEDNANAGPLSKAAASVASTSVATAEGIIAPIPAHHGRGELNPTVAASLAAAAALRLQQPPPSPHPSAHVDPAVAVAVGPGSSPYPPGLHPVAPASSQIPPASAISDSLYGNPLWQTIMRLQQYQNMASLNPFLAAAAAANSLSPDAAVAAVAAVAAAQQQQQQQHQLQMATILAQAQAMQQAAASAAAAAATAKTPTTHHSLNSSDSAPMPSSEGGINSNIDLYRDYLSKYVKATSIPTSNATISTRSIAPSAASGDSNVFLSSAKLSSDRQLQQAAIRSVASSSLTTSTTSSPPKFNIADLDPTSILLNVTGTLNQQRSPISGGPAVGHLPSPPLPPKRHNSSSSSNTISAAPAFSSMAAAAAAAVAAAASSNYGSAARGGSSSRGSTSVAAHQNGRDKVFTCKICNRSFGYKHVLQNHERTHTGEKPFECKVCHKRFTRDHHLKTHMRLHTGEKPYHCTHCERQFVQVANLRRHLRVHTGEKPYKCDLCSSHFSDSNQLKAHILIHKGEKPFSCEHCSGKFRRRHHLMHHVCPKGGGGGGSSGRHIEGDDIDDTVESEKMALLKKWPLLPPLPQPPSESDESERRESIDAPSSVVPAIALDDQNAAHVLLLQQQQQHQKAASMSMAAIRSSDDGVCVASMPLVSSDTEKQRYRKARDPKKRAFNVAAAAAAPFIGSNLDNDEVESASSPEEDQGRQNVQTEPEDLSNKDAIEQTSNSPAAPTT